MKKNIGIFVACILASVFCVTSSTLNAQESKRNDELRLRIKKASLVIEEFMNSPDKDSAASLVRDSAAVAVFPSVYKGAFFVGGQFGRGVMCSYDKKSATWSAPAFFTVGGGSFGFQFGAEAIDLVLVIMNERGLESLLKGKVTLGGDVSVAAGPVGRNIQAETDVLLKAEIYSYSRAKGAFAGFALKGAVVAPDKDSNSLYYGSVRFPEDILLHRKVEPEGITLELVRSLEQFTK
jgi:lipid-binding SYLF domain-containing protein